MSCWEKSGPFSWSCHYSILYTPLFDSLPTRASGYSILYTPFFDSLPTFLRYPTHRATKTGMFYCFTTDAYKFSDSRNTYINTYITHRHRHRLLSRSTRPQAQRMWQRCWHRNAEGQSSGPKPPGQHQDQTTEDGVSGDPPSVRDHAPGEGFPIFLPGPLQEPFRSIASGDPDQGSSWPCEWDYH